MAEVVMTTTVELAEVARRKGGLTDAHTLYMFQLCECCAAPDFCAIKVGLGVKGMVRGKVTWGQRWEGYVTYGEIVALHAEGWTPPAGAAAPQMEQQLTLLD
ncbi:MAG: hypothetical protein IT318_20105 [Anaerolineales bacterium]|nr:hypothetical protein [Anaerolineales bacterium]